MPALSYQHSPALDRQTIGLVVLVLQTRHPEQIAQDPEVQALKQQLDAKAPKPKRKTKNKALK